MPILARGDVHCSQFLVELNTRVPVQAVQVQSGHSLLPRIFGHLLDDHPANALVPIVGLNIEILQEQAPAHPGRVPKVADGVANGLSYSTTVNGLRNECLVARLETATQESPIAEQILDTQLGTIGSILKVRELLRDASKWKVSRRNSIEKYQEFYYLNHSVDTRNIIRTRLPHFESEAFVGLVTATGHFELIKY